MKDILIIDDDAAIVEVLSGAIRDAIPDVRCVSESDFEVAMSRIVSERPDAIVLDLRKDAPPEAFPGQRTWRDIWEKRFCPIVIYTAWGGALDPPVPDNHPYAKFVTKGTGSEALVIGHLRGFIPAVSAIESLRGEVDAVIHQVLRDTAGAGVFSDGDIPHLLHAGRRRIAASMDNPTTGSQDPLRSWEQYLVPAIGESPLTGDVLRRRGADRNSVSDYRLVLTPSCDLVQGRNPTSVLVARCEDMTFLVNRMSLSLRQNRRTDSIRELSSRALTQGVWSGWAPLPEFPGHVPHLAANLKDLEVLPFAAVCREDGTPPEFERVASIDSPFREQVSWAFLTTIARPGMPDRDYEGWATECLDRAVAAASQATAPR